MDFLIIFFYLEIEAIFKSDLSDPELLNDLKKQFTVEQLKEYAREMKPDDFVKCISFIYYRN